MTSGCDVKTFVALVLKRLRREGCFAGCVTGTDVARGKLDLQVFLVAADRIGLAPSQCLVVEDARTGIATAESAGMAWVAMVSNGRTAGELAGADLVVGSLWQLSPHMIHGLVVANQV